MDAKLQELEEEAEKTTDRTKVVAYKRERARMQERWHWLDKRAPYPEAVCALPGILPHRLTTDEHVTSCPLCIADPHFPEAARIAICSQFSVINREVNQIVQAREAGRVAAAAEIAKQQYGAEFLREKLEEESLAVPPSQTQFLERQDMQHLLNQRQKALMQQLAEMKEPHARIENSEVYQFKEVAPGVVQATLPDGSKFLGTDPGFKLPDLRGHEVVTMEQPKAERSVMSRIGDIFVTATKRGTAAGVVRGVTKKVTKVLEQRYPAIALIPDDLRNLVVCAIIHMVATGATDKPGMTAIVSGAEYALEGLVTSAVASTVEEVMDAMASEMEALAFDKPPQQLGSLGG